MRKRSDSNKAPSRNGNQPHVLVIKLPIESRVQFREYLTRVAETPTHNELAEEIDEIAKEILATI